MILALMIYLSTVQPDKGALFLNISDDVCTAIIAHMPQDDVTYKPGVDVKGKPVVEADITATPVRPPETATFDITVDMAKYAGIDVPAGLEGQSTVGKVTVGRDGSITFNGEPMEGPAQAALRDLCSKKEKDPLQKPQKIIYNQ